MMFGLIFGLRVGVLGYLCLLDGLPILILLYLNYNNAILSGWKVKKICKGYDEVTILLG